MLWFLKQGSMCLVQWKKAKKTELPLTKAACNTACLDSKVPKAAFCTALMDSRYESAESQFRLGHQTGNQVYFIKQHVQRAVYLSVPDTASGMRRIMLPADRQTAFLRKDSQQHSHREPQPEHTSQTSKYPRQNSNTNFPFLHLLRAEH